MQAPLSYHQDRLWFIDQFETGHVYPESPVYHNLPMMLRVGARLSRDLLERALNRVIARHPALRTRLVLAAEGPCQDVREELSVRVEEHRLTIHKRGAFSEALAWAVADSRRPLPLDAPALLRATLVSWSDDESLFLLVIHHAIADRASLRLIAWEVAELYSASIEGRDPNLPEGWIGYPEFTRWQRGLSQEVLEPLRFYWRYQLRGRLPRLELPMQIPRPGVHHYREGTHGFQLDPAIIQRTRNLGRDESGSLHCVLLAAFFAILRRYSQQEEIIVGGMESCRSIRGSDRAIGPFANLVALRGDLAGNPAFRALLEQTNRLVAQAHEHRDMPFDSLVLALNPERDMSRTALFDVLFQCDETSDPIFRFGDANADLIDLNLGLGKYDLSLLFRPSHGAIVGTLVFNAEYYEASLIERMCRHFKRLLELVTAQPDQGIDEVPLLSEAEVRQQVFVWNDSAASYPEQQTLHGLFEDQARRTPDGVAVLEDGGRLTYAELEAISNQWAHFLRERGVSPETLVAVCLERTTAIVVALLGILKAGGAYLPVDPDLPDERSRFLMRDAGVQFLLTTELLATRLDAGIAKTIRIDVEKSVLASYPTVPPECERRPQRLAYCIYTSGSTGQPKGVLVEHRNVVRLVVNDRSPFSFTEHDRWTLFHSYAFDFSVWEIFGALLHGGRLIIVPKEKARDPRQFLDLIACEGVTVLNQTPSAFYGLARESLRRPDLPLALRWVIFGGEALHPMQLEEWHAANPGVRLINMYGITETTVHVTFKELTLREISQDCSNIGVPIPTTSVLLMDDRKRLLPVGVPGEIYVGGLGVSRGYLDREELTRERFLTNPYRDGQRLYRSGDRARFLSNGEMIFLGRSDDQVQVRGFRVELGEIQTTILRHPAVVEAEIVASGAMGEMPRLIAYLVNKKEVAIAELRAHLLRTLPEYMMPTDFVVLDELPKTANGKVDRRALPLPTTERPALSAEFVPPRNPTETVLAGIWAAVLDRERVGIHDDFFELGGNSLLATQVASRVRDALGTELPLRHLFEGPTVAQFARVVDAAKPSICIATPRASRIATVKRDRQRVDVDRTGAITSALQ